MKLINSPALYFAALISLAGQLPACASPTKELILPQDCFKLSRTEPASQAEILSMKAKFSRGMHAFRYGKTKDAVTQLSASTTQLYPPAMYLLAQIYISDKRVAEAEPLLRCSAQLGFQKSEWDLGAIYADTDSPVHNDPQAFAWLSLAAEHETAFRDSITPQIALIEARLAGRYKIRAEQLRSTLLENMKSVPNFSDDLCCGSGGGNPRRE